MSAEFLSSTTSRLSRRLSPIGSSSWNTPSPGPVNSAPEALQLAEQTPIDAAFLDVTLESGDSFALAETLLAKGVAVAFITGRDADSLPEKLRSTPILSKPFDFEAMKALLDGMLGSAGIKPAE